MAEQLLVNNLAFIGLVGGAIIGIMMLNANVWGLNQKLMAKLPASNAQNIAYGIVAVVMGILGFLIGGEISKKMRSGEGSVFNADTYGSLLPEEYYGMGRSPSPVDFANTVP